MSNRIKAYIALLTTAVIWGSAFPIIKPSFDHISPFQFLYFRYLIAAPLTLPIIIYFFFKIRPSLKTIAKILALEFFGAPFALSFLYLGLNQTSAIEASLIAATSPIITTLGGIIFLKEKEEKREWLGLAISFLGALLLVFEPLINGQSLTQPFSTPGNLTILAYNFIIAAYYPTAKKIYQHLPKLFVTSLSYSISLVSFVIFLYLIRLPTPVSLLQIPSVALAALYMSLLGSIIALTTRLYGQSLIEASEASLFQYLQGVVAIPVSFFLLKETVTLKQVLAIAIIFFGIFLAELRPRTLDKKTR